MWSGPVPVFCFSPHELADNQVKGDYVTRADQRAIANKDSQDELVDARRIPFAMVDIPVLRHPDVSDQLTRIYGLLITFGPDGIFPGHERLAFHMGCSVRSIIRYLHELRDTWRLITWKRTGRSNKYTILGPDDEFLRSVPEYVPPKKTKTVSDLTPVSDQGDVTPVSDQIGQGDQNSSDTGGTRSKSIYPNPSNENQIGQAQAPVFSLDIPEHLPIASDGVPILEFDANDLAAETSQKASQVTGGCEICTGNGITQKMNHCPHCQAHVVWYNSRVWNRAFKTTPAKRMKKLTAQTDLAVDPIDALAVKVVQRWGVDGHWASARQKTEYLRLVAKFKEHYDYLHALLDWAVDKRIDFDVWVSTCKKQHNFDKHLHERHDQSTDKKRNGHRRRGQHRREYEPCGEDQRQAMWDKHSEWMQTFMAAKREDLDWHVDVMMFQSEIALQLELVDNQSQALCEAFIVWENATEEPLDVAEFFGEAA